MHRQAKMVDWNRKWPWHLCLTSSVTDQAWQLLKLYLDRLGPCDGYVYYRCVAAKLLSCGAALPTWLVNDYKVGWKHDWDISVSPVIWVIKDIVHRRIPRSCLFQNQENRYLLRQKCYIHYVITMAFIRLQTSSFQRNCDAASVWE